MKVAVILGGLSKEREVSLRSGGAFAKALRQKGYEVCEIDAQDLSWIDKLVKQNVAAACVLLHGKYGEDGAVQGVLEWLKIPYTSSGVFASALCFNKLATKRVLMSIGVPSPQYRIFHQNESLQDFINQFDLSFPVVVKPNNEGSSIGLAKATQKMELKSAIAQALLYDHEILVEQMIVGHEVTVGVLNGRALPIIEVVPKSGFYDYESKYTKGATDYLVPTPLDATITQPIQAISEKIYAHLGCHGAIRVDFMLDKNCSPYFLEVNTIPGMTETSLLPKAAGCVGISFEDLCEQILKSAQLKGTVL